MRDDERIGYHALYGPDTDSERARRRLDHYDLTNIDGEFEDGVSA